MCVCVYVCMCMLNIYVNTIHVFKEFAEVCFFINCAPLLLQINIFYNVLIIIILSPLHRMVTVHCF